MPVNYKIYKSNAKNATNGKYYARAIYKETVDIKQLAATMQNNCTVKQSDILAVLTELAEVMKQEFLRGNRVKLDGLGYFKVTLRSKGADDVTKFTAADNITGIRLLFIPETSIEPNGSHVRNMIAGIKLKEVDNYESLRTKDAANDGE